RAVVRLLPAGAAAARALHARRSRRAAVHPRPARGPLDAARLRVHALSGRLSRDARPGARDAGAARAAVARARCGGRVRVDRPGARYAGAYGGLRRRVRRGPDRRDRHGRGDRRFRRSVPRQVRGHPALAGRLSRGPLVVRGVAHPAGGAHRAVQRAAASRAARGGSARHRGARGRRGRRGAHAGGQRRRELTMAKPRSPRIVRHGALTAGGICAFGACGSADAQRETFSNPPEIASANGELRTTFVVGEVLVRVADKSVYTLVYNGEFMPPLLRVRPADTIYLDLLNETTEPTNEHYHGMNVSPRVNADGTVSDNVLISVESGAQASYRIHVPETHNPGLYWYHAHLHGLAEHQVMGGLSGGLIVEGILDPFPELQGIRERVF